MLYVLLFCGVVMVCYKNRCKEKLGEIRGFVIFLIGIYWEQIYDMFVNIIKRIPESVSSFVLVVSLYVLINEIWRNG